MLKREETIDNLKEVIQYLEFLSHGKGSVIQNKIDKLNEVLDFLEG